MDNLTLEWARDHFAHQDPGWGFNGLGYVVYKKSYARLKDNEKKEEWWETVHRVVNGMQSVTVGRYTREELEFLYGSIFNLKCFPSGRGLWQLGTEAVEQRRDGNSLLNCWFVRVDRLESFLFAFERLMLGGGVGFSVQRKFIYKLPKVKRAVRIIHEKTADADFIVPDSRQGWIETLRKVFESFFKTGKGFSYSTILVRGKGEKIKGFGGQAAGPQVLVNGIDHICKVFLRREGKQLLSVDCLDIMNIIGEIVVSGNIRRSAQIAIGDADDVPFMRAKRWDLGTIPIWRKNSNNSMDIDDVGELSDEFWMGYEGNGEPYGMVSVNSAQEIGRIGEKRPDNAEGFNPCAEACLADREACNLSEIILPRLETLDEGLKISRLLYIYQKFVCNLDYGDRETNKIEKENQRIGQGVTGILHDVEKFIPWLDAMYGNLRKIDKNLSRQFKFNPSIRMTVIKPSGTLSLLPGVTPGCHPAFSPHYIRRVRMSSDDPLVAILHDAGFPMESLLESDGTYNRDTMVVGFPCESPKQCIASRDLRATEHLELVKRLNTAWTDQSTSVSVYYHKEELPEIKKWLKKNWEGNFKSLSFILHSEHGFAQPAYEEISKGQYDDLRKKINYGHLLRAPESGQEGLKDNLECEGGACPAR